MARRNGHKGHGDVEVTINTRLFLLCYLNTCK